MPETGGSVTTTKKVGAKRAGGVVGLPPSMGGEPTGSEPSGEGSEGRKLEVFQRLKMAGRCLKTQTCASPRLAHAPLPAAPARGVVGSQAPQPPQGPKSDVHRLRLGEAAPAVRGIHAAG